MRVTLNVRGQIALTVVVLLTSFSVYLRYPTLILLSTLIVAYIIAYPIYVRNLDKPEVEVEAIPRHGIIFRGEVDILKIVVSNKGDSQIPIAKLVIDMPGTLFVVDQPLEYILSLPGKSNVVLNLPILPTARGSYVIGPIDVYVGDPFLFYQEKIASVEQIGIRVYPKRLGYKVPRARQHLVFSRLIGLFSLRQKGVGTEFHSLRDYNRGDSIKIIDWAATARKNELVSKEFEDEKRLNVIVALAAGTTTRGQKFDFMLGLMMDIFEGIVKENHPVGIVIFEDEVIEDFPITTSHRKKMHIWSRIYNIIPKDVYPDYRVLRNYIEKKGITGDLVIVLGDFASDNKAIDNAIREIRLRGNYVIFIDIWGYKFSYEKELLDAAYDFGSDNYGMILSQVIGQGLNQDNVFNALEMKQQFLRHRTLYGYIQGPGDNIVDALERALFGFFGQRWKGGKYR